MIDQATEVLRPSPIQLAALDTKHAYDACAHNWIYAGTWNEDEFFFCAPCQTETSVAIDFEALIAQGVL